MNVSKQQTLVGYWDDLTCKSEDMTFILLKKHLNEAEVICHIVTLMWMG